jgi:hypothetical protein
MKVSCLTYYHERMQGVKTRKNIIRNLLISIYLFAPQYDNLTSYSKWGGNIVNE